MLRAFLTAVLIGTWLLACSATSDAGRSTSGSPSTNRGAAGRASPGIAANGGGAEAPGGDRDANWASMAPVLAGSGAEPPAAPRADGHCGSVEQKARNMLQPVDVILSIDTSGTMRDEIMFVKENMNAFSQQIRDRGVDVRVVLIAAEWTGMEDPFGGLLFTDGLCIDPPLGSGQCPADSRAPEYAHVVEVIGQWNILDAYILRYADYKAYLRPSSLKTFVSVSDTDASTTADKFVADVDGLEPGSSMWSNWRYSAIYPFDTCLADATPGLVHADLVQRTGGVGGDLCNQDFAPVFDDLAKKLVADVKLACDWSIPAAPPGEMFEIGKTNVQLTVNGTNEALLKAPTIASCGTNEGWHYDDEANPSRVIVCPATCDRIQAAESAEINVLFGCATQLGPE